MEKKRRDELMELFLAELFKEGYGLTVGQYGIYARRDGKLDKNLCRAAAQRHLRETPQEFVKSLVADDVHDPRFAKLAILFHDHLRELCGLASKVVNAAQFACSPEGHRRGSGAMRRLNEAVAALEK